ncbi:hypothetical protein Taro_046142 [Colocasia esculenta]|uniref:SBP-type domain-containing protein n=1 Tax=Colocasia esculenta TaxID=4460 RepID=A0A843X1N3_COLES|nr:hypothetical protein [Colocasia esculenta]
MEWDLKMPLWDLAELERGADANVRPSFYASSGPAGRQAGGLDCSVDLKLGRLGDFGSSSSDKCRDQTRTSTTTASPTSSAKRARAPSNGVHNAACLVDGCKSDLSNCREYHRRHKVCEVHSKTPVVMVHGQEQRFCQQCSRFHLLVEFDEGKRSCRKRLDGHNRRRRKPQPDTANSASLFVNHQGPRFSSYSQMFPATTPEANWAAVVKTEEDVLYAHNSPLHFIDKQQHFPGSFCRGYKEERPFPFFQENDSALGNRTIDTTVCQPLLNTISSSESSSNKLFSNGLTQALDSDCALSLLSSPTQTSSINLGHMLPADRIPMGQPLVSSLHQYGGLSHYSHSQASNTVSSTGFSCSGAEDEQVGTVLVSDASDVDLHCQGIFQLGVDGTSGGASQAIPFSWQ